VPWLTHPGVDGHSTTHTPSSSRIEGKVEDHSGFSLAWRCRRLPVAHVVRNAERSATGERCEIFQCFAPVIRDPLRQPTSLFPGSCGVPNRLDCATKGIREVEGVFCPHLLSGAGEILCAVPVGPADP